MPVIKWNGGNFIDKKIAVKVFLYMQAIPIMNEDNPMVSEIKRSIKSFISLKNINFEFNIINEAIEIIKQSIGKVENFRGLYFPI